MMFKTNQAPFPVCVQTCTKPEVATITFPHFIVRETEALRGESFVKVRELVK